MLQTKESTAFKISGERKQKPNNPCQPEFSIQNFLSAPIFGERKKEQVALKLNRPKDKNARYKSQKLFLLQCIQAELIPK